MRARITTSSVYQCINGLPISRDRCTELVVIHAVHASRTLASFPGRLLSNRADGEKRAWYTLHGF